MAFSARLTDTGLGLRADVDDNTSHLKNSPSRGLPKIITAPSGFQFPLPLKIKRNYGGYHELIDFDIEKLHPITTGKAYYVSKTGNNTNDGLTKETAFATITQALTKADAEIIYIAEGSYGRQSLYTANFPDRNLKIKAIEGEKVTVGLWDEAIIWTVHATGTYKTTRSATVAVYDTKILNAFGNYTRYAKKTTITDVVATPGSWFLDTDNQLYIHTLDDREPANVTDIKVVISSWGIKGGFYRNYYFSGITFEFGDAALEVSNAKQVIAENCQFNYSQTKNGLHINDTDLIITKNCIALENFADGFNYHADTWSTKHLYFLEIDNVGYRNGWSGATISNNNGSTSHVNCVGVRLNGLYFENNGPNIADVGTRNYTWDIGCTAYDSRYAGSGFIGIDFLTENKKWMDGCIAYNSDISAYEGIVDGTLYTRDCILDKVQSGNVIPY